ncbi:hypothetical protein NZD89_19745 [Alicyclobacillus fastidiosus]|uniref:YggT family protein n=1 Tax=Alicyclobacillus fastidiosus TaxID=392011 RepID=A0ABY6ZCB6_9BACL|nr:hypothetical protein [Alicyclobacillus fastidiosus]WAH40530.1 hypothetical protein NZD89_19745 [Alicyclobacillus fastidiosus]GMA61959.1 hypothetical protein GCM10025859_23990 [Alicyclobacillus fastidiosus]
MLSIILSNAAMLLAFQVVLIVLGLNMIVKLLMNLRKSEQVSTLADVITRPVLTDVFPLIIISLLTMVDPTHVIALIFYYLAALFVVVRALLELSKTLKK